MPNPRKTSAALLGLAVTLATAAGGSPPPVPVTVGPNIDLSVETQSPGAVQRETTVAINPRDPLNVVAGNIDRIPNAGRMAEACSFSFTTDGGRTWALGGPVPVEASGDPTADPWLTADADGNFYYAYLEDHALNGIFVGSTDLVVAKSTDGGRTFSTLSVAVPEGQVGDDFFAADKDAVAADAWPASPFKGTVYAAFTNFNFGGYQIAVVVSRDGGPTWSRPAVVSPTADFATRGLFGALPVVAPDGSVYVFWADFLFNTGPMSIVFSRSTDGGATWSKPSAVASGLPSPGFFRLKDSDNHWDTKDLVGIGANSLPTAAAGPDGTLFVAWTDFPQGSCVNDGTTDGPCIDSDVRLSVSTNGGKSWSAPVKVSDDAGATDQFYPAIAAHPSGLLSLSWQDKRLDPGNEDFDTFYTNTFDGKTFLPNVRVSDATSLSGVGQTQDFDYNSIAAGPDSFYPVWCDLRSGNPDIDVAAGRLSR